ncbi:MAG TPA: hypothetical protein VN541_23615 [Tepidisphaeraceae bacterium]|nr:hypothetical protein [Tepidisphaeraceae bacterium]
MRFSRHWILPSLAGLLIGFAAGCQGRATIPSGAHMEQSGAGGLSYTAHESGNVYVLDADKNKKVFEGHMNNGDQIVLHPQEDQIMLAGNNAEHSTALNPNHRYEIYFDPSH